MSERANRVITNLAATEYFGMERLSSGGVKQLLRSPAHYRAWKDAPRLPSPAMQFGSAVHVLTLEPETADERIGVMPDDSPDRRTNAGREWHAQFLANNVGKIVLTVEDYMRARRCAMAVLQSPGWRGIVDHNAVGHRETSLLWHDEETGVLCKARPDYFADDNTVCVDLKTTTDASREVFMRQLWNLRYDIQASFYLEGLYVTRATLPHSFAWCVVESDEPHGVAWYRIPHGELEIARADISNASRLYADCLQRQEWRGYPSEVQDIRLPAWARSAQRTALAPLALQEF